MKKKPDLTATAVNSSSETRGVNAEKMREEERKKERRERLCVPQEEQSMDKGLAAFEVLCAKDPERGSRSFSFYTPWLWELQPAQPTAPDGEVLSRGVSGVLRNQDPALDVSPPSPVQTSSLRKIALQRPGVSSDLKKKKKREK